ncbi:MAG: hypothetical protein AB7G93_09430 [Bdellovibrionales bacterium]
MNSDDLKSKGQPVRTGTAREEVLLTICRVTVRTLREWYADLAEGDETKRKILDGLLFQIEILLKAIGESDE